MRWVYPELRAIIEEHRAAGRTLILNTASPDFYPYEDSSDVGPSTEVLDSTAEKVRLSKTVKKPEDKPWPRQIHGIVVNGKGENRKSFEVSFVRGNTGRFE